MHEAGAKGILDAIYQFRMPPAARLVYPSRFTSRRDLWKNQEERGEKYDTRVKN